MVLTEMHKILSKHQIDTHIQYIRECLFGKISQREEDELRNVFENAKCFRGRNNELVKVSDLFDPDNPIFQEMLNTNIYEIRFHTSLTMKRYCTLCRILE